MTTHPRNPRDDDGNNGDQLRFVPSMSKFPQIGQAGTLVYKVNGIRKFILPKVLDHLTAAEQGGLSEPTREAIRLLLQRLADISSDLPKLSFWSSKSICNHFEDMVSSFDAWSQISNSDPKGAKKRLKHVKEIRKSRTAIATKIRNNQAIIEQDWDLKVVQAQYKAAQDMYEALPEFFADIGKALKQLAKRDPGIFE